MLVTCLDYFVSCHLSNNTCISHRSFLIELPCHDIVLPTRRRAIYAAIVRPPSTLVPPPLRPSSHCWRKCLWWQRHGRSKIRNQPLLVRSTSILSTAFEEADCRPLSFWPPWASRVCALRRRFNVQFQQLSRTWPQAQVALWISQHLSLYCFSGIYLSNFSLEVEVVDNVPHAMATNDV